MPVLSDELKRMAAAGARAEIKRLQAFLAELEGEERKAPAAPTARAPRRRRKMSAEARERIRQAQLTRWAKVRKKKEKGA